MQVTGERIERARSVQNQKDQNGDRDQHEQTDSELAKAYVSSCFWHDFTWKFAILDLPGYAGVPRASSIADAAPMQAGRLRTQVTSVSAQKLLNVSIVRFAQRFVRAAKDYLAVAHHQDLAIDETKLLAFRFEYDFAGFVDDRVFRS